MKKGKLYISILFGLCLCLFTAFFTACKEETPPAPTLESISVSGETEVFIDEFDYADYTITATYSDNSTKTATLTADNLSADDNAKLSTVGTHSLTVSYESVTCSWTVTLKNHEFSDVTFDDVTTTYDGTAKTLAVSGLPTGAQVSYDKATSYTNAGEYTVKATVTLANYNPVELTATLTINKATYDMSAVAFADKTVTYNGESHSIEATNLPNGVTAEYTGNNQINAGEYEITAMFKGDNQNYEPIASQTATLTIKKATYDMSGVLFKDKSVNYNGQAHSIEATNLPEGVSVRYDGNGKTQAGEYTVTAIFTGDSRNYNAIPNMTATLKINASDLTGVSFHDGEFTYDGTKKSIYITGELPEDVTVDYTNNEQINADSYTVTATFTCTNGNYTNLPELTATLTIKKAVYDMSAVVFADKTVTYDGQAHSIETTNLPQGVTAEYTGNKQINAGEYEITATFKGDSQNYELIASQTVTLTIEQRELTLAFNGETTLKYNGKAQKTITVQATNLVNGDSVGLTVSYNGEMIEAGEYIATATLTAHKNYKLTANNTVKVTITRATHTVTFKQDGVADIVKEVLDLADLTDIPQPKTVDGYTFTWNRTDFTSITEDITVTANKTVITYTIEYVLQYGKNPTENPKTYTVESASITLKAPTASETFGTTFGGWFTSPDFSLDSKITKIAKGTTGDLKLYAYWLEYRVTEVVGGAVDYSQATPKITIKVDYGTANLAVKDLISVSDGCSWKLYTGFECLPTQELTAKRLSVSNIGDNIFYILVYHPDSDEYYTDYVLNVYQLDMKTYTFLKDGETWANGEIQEESALNAPENPEKDGYTFDGWKVNGEFVSFPYTVLTDTEFIAVYTPIEYTVTFNPNGGTVNQLTRTYTIETGMTFENPTREHYDFKGWYNGETQEGAVTGIKIGTWGDFEFYAKWTPTEYTVTYYHNDSTVKEITSNSYTITNNSSSSWTESSGVLKSTNKTHSSSSVYKITANETFIVSFEYKVSSEQKCDKLIIAKNGTALETVSGSTSYVAYSVTLNAGDYLTFTYSKDGSQSSGDDCAYIKNLTYAPKEEAEKVTTQAYNIETPTFDLITPTKTGYTFAGWFTEATFENQVTEIALGSHGNKKFYAKWGENTNTLKFDGNGATDGEMPDIEMKTTFTATLPECGFTRVGYTFIGYATSKNGLVVYNVGDTYTMGTNAEYTLYAKWTANENTLKFDGNGATGGNMSEMKIHTDETQSLTENIFVRAGYTFQGWALTADGEVAFADKADYTMGVNAEYTLYAVWQANKNTLNFNGNGSTSGSMSSMTIATDFTATLTVNKFVRTGYTFQGWATSTDGEVVYTDGAEYVMGTNSSYTLYAVWLGNLNTICFDGNGATGGEMSSVQARTGETITLPLNTYTNTSDYTYTGWAKAANSSMYYDDGANYAVGTASEQTLYAVWKQQTTSGLVWSISNNKVTITDYVGTNTEIAIPETIGGYPVTNISSSAFYNCSRLTEITLPFVGASKSATGYQAVFGYIFGYTTSSSIDTISGATYQYCDSSSSSSYKYYHYYIPTSLKKVTITGGNIGSSAFYHCDSLTSVVIGDSVTSIGSSAFYHCDSLTSVVIGDSVTSIGSSAFSSCSRLTSIEVDENNTAYKSIDGNLYRKDATTLIQYAIGKTATTFNIPDSVTSIGSYAFSGCSSLKSIEIPESVTSIGDFVFYYCDSLKSIEIPESVTSIGDSAFRNCSSLTSVVIGNSVTSIGSSAFYKCDSLTSVYIKDIESWCNISFGGSSANPLDNGANLYLNNELVTELVIPNTVTEIKSYAFEGCSSLTSVVIGDGVTSIGSSAFENCSSLTSIEIPDSVTSIGSSAFEECSSLIEMTIPFVGATKNGTSNTYFGYIFGANGYYYNDDDVPTALKKVTIMGGDIGSSAFAYCDSLTSVTIGGSVTSIGNAAFYNCDSLREMTIPFVGASKDTTGYQAVFGYIFGYTTSSSIDTISGATFQYYDSSSSKYYHYYIPTSLKKVTITGGDIGEGAFRNCSNLTSVGIGDSVTSIGSSAFYNCSSLTSVVIGNGVTSIGSSAFYNCSSLTSVVIPDSVTSIGSSAFSGCSSLTSVVIGDSVTSIGSWAFNNCSNLTSVVIGDSVTSIGSAAFNKCSNLTSVYITDIEAWCNISGLSELMGYSSNSKKLYLNNELLTELVIPNTVTEIKSYAFYNCSSLTSVVIGNGVTSIGSSAFRYCSSLTSIKYCGTQDQWNAISKGSYWNSSTGSYTITYNYQG